ncbi:uncharacterized protein LOC114536054 [Dendronephthya gigantea]|uniref:uncharacterized protein LOC114536054 n=1 Tax=Dendronephthya gigantea TaxID=151771 RepID=UPI00106D26C9|nr:uncharacterized protein LOC114536054 [Dendronephthya gigantea]
MATYKGGKGQRGGDYRKREPWIGQREYGKSGSSSPVQRRSNSPRHFRPDHKDHRDASKMCAHYLNKAWREVEQDLKKDQNITGTVEYVAKTPTDIKDEELCKVHFEPKNREEKPASPD